MGLDDREYRQNDPWKKNPKHGQKYSYDESKGEMEFDSNHEKMTTEEIRSYYEQIEKIRNKKNPAKKNRKNVTKNQEHTSLSNWIFIFPIIILIVTIIIKNAYHEKNEPVQQITPIVQAALPKQPEQNNQVISRAPTPEEEKAYMQEHNLIKLGNEYHWCGIKESKDILPVTKALDIGCQNDLCRITKYYDYVKQIPYEKGTNGRDKNAIDVMQEWKGDCDERSDLLASMMLANGYKVILLYTNSHALTALNIPNYESNENRSYVKYQGRLYYIAETTDLNGQIGAYNDEVMHSIKYIYDINEKRVVSNQEVNIQLYK